MCVQLVNVHHLLMSERILLTQRSMKLRFLLSVSLLEVTESETLSRSAFRLEDFSSSSSGGSSDDGVDSNNASELCVREGGEGESMTLSEVWLRRDESASLCWLSTRPSVLRVREGDPSRTETWAVSRRPSTLCVRKGIAALRRRVFPFGLVGGRQAGVSGLDDLRRLQNNSLVREPTQLRKEERKRLLRCGFGEENKSTMTGNRNK